MTVNEAAEALREYYLTAPDGEKSIQGILFGIQYAEQIAGFTTPEIVRQATGVPSSYTHEVEYGRKLAKYVTLKGDTP